MKDIPTRFYFSEMTGPLGRLLLVASDEGLRTVSWNQEPPSICVKSPRHPVLAQAKKQLTEYFAGRRTEFDLPLALKGTPFQLKAWAALKRIPYGKTISYQEQARSLGGPNFARAAGTANRSNPIPIIVPCHRVVGKNGELTGYFYGVGAKRFLLDLEQKR